jgi:hypothetical protein
VVDDPSTVPTAAAFDPNAGQVVADPNRALVVQFSERMDPNTLTAGSFEIVGTVPGTTNCSSAPAYDPNTRRATCLHVPLGDDAYTVTVKGTGPNAVRNHAGVPLDGNLGTGGVQDFVYTFTVGAVAPAVDGNNVCGTTFGTLTPTITVTFTEPMDSNSITATTFHVDRVQGSQARPCSAGPTYDAPTRTVSCTVPLDPNSTFDYRLTIEGGGSGTRVLDLTGNSLSADFTCDFNESVPANRKGGGDPAEKTGRRWTQRGKKKLARGAGR